MSSRLSHRRVVAPRIDNSKIESLKRIYLNKMEVERPKSRGSTPGRRKMLPPLSRGKIEPTVSEL